MAILRGGGFHEGSLLRRTLLYVGTFAVGSLAVVTLLSFTLVSLAKTLLPSQKPKADASSAQKADAPDDGETSAGKSGSPKLIKPKRTRGAITEEESPTREEK